MNARKIITILDYLALKLNSVSKLKAIKLLYFIDKEHFVRFGRFVTNKPYVKMKYGPVPLTILSIIDSPSSSLEKDDYSYLKRHISFAATNYRTITSIKQPDLDKLSESEIEVIDAILSEIGNKTSSELVDKSHEEYAWINTSDFDVIPVEKIVHGLPKEKKEKILARYNDDLDTRKIFPCVM
jgi:uncharacterized phage-associated protein